MNPLRDRVFRSLWIAVLASNAGTWMQTVGAQWLVVREPNAATWVSLVQVATMTPVLLLALPSGALADVLDRRLLLLAVQIGLFSTGAALSVLTWLGLMPPGLLLFFTFLLGVGQALTLPTWQAVIPEVVPREELPTASALGAVNTNLARSAGPAVAGLIVAQVGSAAVFGLNALSYAVFAAALLRWHRPRRTGPSHPQRFGPALRAGEHYVRYAPVVTRLLARVVLFVLPGSVVWGLLPLVAHQELGLGATGYGILLAALGVGAIIGALLMPRIRRGLSPGKLIVLAGLVYGVALVVVALVPQRAAVIPALIAAGLAWMTLVSRMNATLQLFLPNWVRARGFGIYQVVFAGSQAVGALVWGQVTALSSLRVTFLAAAAAMLSGTATVRLLPVYEQDGADRSPAIFWPEPHIMLQPHLDDGPVLVTAVYRVDEPHVDSFIKAMEAVRGSRLRTGASRWGLFRDGATPDKFTEIYQMPTWDEYLRQRAGRLTGSDEEAERKATSLARGPAEVTHLFPADSAEWRQGRSIRITPP
ncbi:MFS transporter [Actinoplanes sp. TBRC 11911]|uniref:MFS transporter n=1 Tax=Actinoplanes sp. TBRC 11911 TaxID=2729386 RepID=UPI00145EF718|nr:MFS transporter [Actinoplanes sp. TBRC 11911]NMO55212.1 MFS transporter [Actinoplanes sp. TBRC 11911]